MIFYALHLPGRDQDRIKLLEAACGKNGLKLKLLDPYSFDFSKPSPVKAGDIVYRVTRGRLLHGLEDYVLKGGVVTFYSDRKAVPGRPDPFVLIKNGIPAPKTIFCSTKDRKKLAEYVKKLGGFPVVLKSMGGTHGLGVMKIDTFSSLFSMLDYMLAQNKVAVLMEYIPAKTSARMIVLGDRVVASMEYRSLKDDFRTNEAGKLDVVAKEYPRQMQEIAIKATKAFGVEFGGVDILVKGNKPYVCEVNFPCNFARAYEVLRKNVALDVVKFLKEKALALNYKRS